MTRTTTTLLALAAGAAALGVSAPARARVAGMGSRAGSPAKTIVQLCLTGYTRKTVTTDRFTLAGCIKDLTEPITGVVSAYQALGAVTLNGATLSPETAGSLLTLQRK